MKLLFLPIALVGIVFAVVSVGCAIGLAGAVTGAAVGLGVGLGGLVIGVVVGLVGLVGHLAKPLLIIGGVLLLAKLLDR